ncbi:MAG: 1-phosphofructokinase family hexose kinase [Eubacteriales bacterium]|nr:1-phosphofructokinase family hexose kinase [Eubacteriales bacterium]
MILTVTLNTSIDKLYMLETLAPYTVMRVKQVHNTAGGKGLNVTRVAARLGEPVTAMGFVGGYNGRYLESLITEPLIRKAFTHVASETRSCINGWDQSCGKSTEYLEPGAPVTAEEVRRFTEDFQRELPGADAVTISGSLPQGVSTAIYGDLIHLCRQAGKPVLLDTSGEILRQGVKAMPTFIKPNADEIGQLLGAVPETQEALVNAALALHKSGIPIVALSMGAEGALVACADGVYRGKPPCIEPVNTVGCGDSMVAGFAFGIVRNFNAVEQLRLAIAVSAANALSMGTGGFDERDFHSLLPDVEIQQIQ